MATHSALILPAVLLLLFSATLWTSIERRLYFVRFASSRASSPAAPNRYHLLHARTSRDECLSRLDHRLYYGNGEPSGYFISKIREYEKLHKKCAKEAEQFSHNLSANGSYSTSSESDCRFIVWISHLGLGNKMLSIASAFLYALVTNRVLLLDKGTDMPDLFCEPFPDTSWFVPDNFPHDYLHGLDHQSPNNLARVLQIGDKCEASKTVNALPSVLYVALTWDAKPLDQQPFYCKQQQDLIQDHVPWLLVRSDVYYIPHLYFIDSFREEFHRMFPDQDTVFHYTARYLFHPSNSIWEKTRRFYETYLSEADLLVGFQIRPLNKDSIERYWKQSIECALQKEILPNVSSLNSSRSPLTRTRGALKNRDGGSYLVNVLVVSLNQFYYDMFMDFYLQHSTQNQSQIVKIHFASHEGTQQTDKLDHDKKAVMEIYLLAMCDELVTTSRSTYGYIANAYAGIKPWTIPGFYIDTVVGRTKEPCFKTSTVEPCFLRIQTSDCDCTGAKPRPSDVKPCQDTPWGLRIEAPVNGTGHPQH